MPKIDRFGAFCKFQGVTIVSHANSSCYLVWNKVYQILSRDAVVCQSFSLLPPDSYHITTTNLYTQEGISEHGWSSLISGNLDFFQTISSELVGSFKHEFAAAVNPRLINIKGVLQLFFLLPDDFQQAINTVASAHGLEGNIPPSFHVTLAYQNKPISSHDVRHLDALMSNIVHVLNSLGPLNFDPPRLCSFNDMTNFEIWDGKDNPFIEEIAKEPAYNKKSGKVSFFAQPEAEPEQDLEQAVEQAVQIKPSRNSAFTPWVSKASTSL